MFGFKNVLGGKKERKKTSRHWSKLRIIMLFISFIKKEDRKKGNFKVTINEEDEVNTVVENFGNYNLRGSFLGKIFCRQIKLNFLVSFLGKIYQGEESIRRKSYKIAVKHDLTLF